LDPEVRESQARLSFSLLHDATIKLETGPLAQRAHELFERQEVMEKRPN
jgi:hypothetical protein